MCLAIPSKVIRVVSSDKAVVESDDAERIIDISLIKKVKSGDYVLVHDGLGIQKLDRRSAEEIIKLACR